MKIIFLILCLNFIFLSCEMDFQTKRTWYASDVEVVTEKSDEYNFAAIGFNLFNNSGKIISDIEFSFFLYDSNGEKVGHCGNKIICKLRENILPEENKKILVSIDSAVGSVVKEKYFPGNFCIDKIIYKDGSEWKDLFSFFSID